MSIFRTLLAVVVQHAASLENIARLWALTGGENPIKILAMSFVVIKLAGKQYLVKAGNKIQVENLRQPVGKTLKLDQVLLVANSSVKIGKPVVKNSQVSAKIVKNIKGAKIAVTKFRPKSRYLRRQGFRANLTEVEITQIG